MSYTVLARRYRSGTFDELIGQDAISRTLKKAISSGRIAHAYLFCGTRGTGKTSTARILAKCLNCEKSDGPTPTPCNECSSCQGIARGDDIDVIEIDAASNTGVENVRDLIENSQYRPARSRFKVYIIDEVHMLSKSAFNALLKTLEEPPSHVKFILATTEPEKVLPTILSRCQRYDFRNIPTREIAQHLKAICKNEGLAADDDALLLVARAGAGSMRDAISLLDRLLSIGERHLKTEMVEQLLGLPRSQLLFDLSDAIGRGDTKQTLEQAHAIIAAGLSPEGLVAALVDHLRNLLILATCGPDSELVEAPGLDLNLLVEQARRFDAVMLTQGIAILQELRRQLRQSQAGAALLDATLVRLALADQFASIAELLSRTDGRPAGAGRAPQLPVKSAVQRPAPEAQKKNADERPAPRVTPAIEQPPQPPASAEPAASLTTDDDDDDLPRPGKVWDGPSLKDAMQSFSKTAAPIKQAGAPPPAPAEQQNIEPIDPSDLPGVWNAVLKLLGTQGQSVVGVLSSGRLSEIAQDTATVQLSPQQETFARQWEKNGKKELVREALSKALGRPTGVRFEVSQSSAPVVAREKPTAVPAASTATTAAPIVRITPEVVEGLRERVPLVRAVMDQLGGQVVKIEE